MVSTRLLWRPDASTPSSSSARTAYGLTRDGAPRGQETDGVAEHVAGERLGRLAAGGVGDAEEQHGVEAQRHS